MKKLLLIVLCFIILSTSIYAFNFQTNTYCEEFNFGCSTTTLDNLDVNLNINVNGNYTHQGNVGFNGTCINVTYSGGIAISCND